MNEYEKSPIYIYPFHTQPIHYTTLPFRFLALFGFFFASSENPCVLIVLHALNICFYRIHFHARYVYIYVSAVKYIFIINRTWWVRGTSTPFYRKSIIHSTYFILYMHVWVMGVCVCFGKMSLNGRGNSASIIYVNIDAMRRYCSEVKMWSLR